MSKLTISGIRQIARKNLTKNALNYYESGADYEQTLSENCRAYDRLKVCPHIAENDCTESIDLTTYILGRKLGIPICIAPTAMQKMAHNDGEIGTAKGAFSYNTYMGVSTLSTTSYEDIASAVPNCLYIMQLYIYKNKSLSTELVRRAEKCGFEAIALTVDTPILGQRIADVKEKFKLPSHLELANYSNVEGLVNVASEKTSGLMDYVGKNIENTLSWDNIVWLRSITKLPILLKGIITKEDAVECVKRGIQGIIVSNHGGRQLDGVPATIEALPEVVRAVQGKIPVFVDGGIRRGSDVFKALALGAKAVFIGRPVLYGLAYNGTDGVKKVLDILVEELKDVMALTGCNNIKDITVNLVRHETAFGITPTQYSYNWNWKPTPGNPVCMEDIKEGARGKGVVVDDHEERRNSDAFMRLRLRPRRLQGVSKPNPSSKVFGKCLNLPVILNVSGERKVHYHTEAIRVANSFRTYLTVSTTHKSPNHISSDYLLDVNNLKEDRNVILKHVNRHQKNFAQCKGLIVSLASSGTTWDDVKWITTVSHDIPVIVKGVMTKEMASNCLKHDVQGIVVSNPCKSSDNWLTPSPIEVLPEIVEAINYKIPVFLEGGIRKGTDILKALALGATAVFIDKPLQWGFAHQGEEGMENVMKILREELERAMFLAGTSNVKEITSSLVVHESYYWNVGSSSLSKL